MSLRITDQAPAAATKTTRAGRIISRSVAVDRHRRRPSVRGAPLDLGHAGADENRGQREPCPTNTRADQGNTISDRPRVVSHRQGSPA